MEHRELPAALQLMDESIATIQASVNAGKGGGYLLPGYYTFRSSMDLALSRASQAEAETTKALAALHAVDGFTDASSKLGGAYLAQARALAAQGKTVEARTAASRALAHLQGSLGPDHPDTESARLLTE